MSLQDISKIKNFCKVEKINNAEAIFFPVSTGSMGIWLRSFISTGKNNFTGLFSFLKGLDRWYSLVQLFYGCWIFIQIGFFNSFIGYWKKK